MSVNDKDAKEPFDDACDDDKEPNDEDEDIERVDMDKCRN